MTGASLAAAIALVAAGVALLRAGWRRPGARAAVAAGWLALAAGSALLVASDGAWGAALAGLSLSVAAVPILALAATERRATRAATERRGPAPAASPLGHRLAVLLLVTLGAGIAAAMAGLAAFAVGRAAGWAEADSLSLAFFAWPLVWTLLVVAMMLRSGPRAMLAPPGATLAASLCLLWLAW